MYKTTKIFQFPKKWCKAKGQTVFHQESHLRYDHMNFHANIRLCTFKLANNLKYYLEINSMMNGPEKYQSKIIMINYSN